MIDPEADEKTGSETASLREETGHFRGSTMLVFGKFIRGTTVIRSAWTSPPR